jgi:hypothetical protein
MTKNHVFVSFLVRNYSLLGLLVLLVFVVPVFPCSWHDWLYDVLFSLVYFSAALTIYKYRKILYPVAVAIVVMLWLFRLLNLHALNTLSAFVAVVYFCFIVVNFIVMIARSKQVDALVIIKAINGYLLLAVMFSLIIVVVMFYNPDAIAFPEQAAMYGESMNNFGDYMYFVVITMATVGYGDVVPVLPVARSLSTFIAITGQLYVAILIAMLVGKYLSNQNK